MPKGSNPKSAANLQKSSRRQGTSTKTKQHKSVTLSQQAIELAQSLGEGNLSHGLSIMAQYHLVLWRAKELIESVAADDKSPYSELAESLAIELEELEGVAGIKGEL